MVAFAVALPAEAATKTALLVVGSTALGAGDAAIKARLDRFYATTVLDDGAPADTSKDLVVISASASPSLVGARYKAAPGGALVLQPQLFDDMAMTASGAFGTASAQTKVKIVADAHQTAAGFKNGALVTVHGSGRNVGWGTPAASARKVALTADGNTAHATIFAYEARAAMAGGFVAPARRVGYYVTAADALARDGWRLFDYALDHADGNVPPVGGGSARAITWSSTITRLASGCDAWTPTRAPDGSFYTAYGDCNGASGALSPKRSMGLARITGSPAAGDVAAADIDTGPPGAPDIDADPGGLDALGAGSSGKKPSGMLFANGTLYAWVRNVQPDGTRSRLRYAANYGQPGSAWGWAPWTLEEFGYPVFVQAGQADAGGGAYAYVVAHDGPSAYKPADRFVLMRVPVDRILEQEAYEFFAGTAGAPPAWVGHAERARRTAIFESKGRCFRSGMSYNAARGRYYWWQARQPSLDGGDERFFGGFGVYSAPEPWGPWTPVYYTEKWDVGPGERGEFPPAWMGPAGLGAGGEMYLLFSGGDALSIRRGTIAAGF
jgi:hypothetical protein